MKHKPDFSPFVTNNPKTNCMKKKLGLNILAKHRIELFRDVILFVLDLRLAQLDDNVGICLPIDISRVKICSLWWGGNRMGQNQGKCLFESVHSELFKILSLTRTT